MDAPIAPAVSKSVVRGREIVAQNGYEMIKD